MSRQWVNYTKQNTAGLPTYIVLARTSMWLWVTDLPKSLHPTWGTHILPWKRTYQQNRRFKNDLQIITTLLNKIGLHAVAQNWGTALQAGRSWDRFPMVSLEFFIDIILPVALWPWGRLRLLQKWVPEIFPGGKGGRCVLKSGSLKLLEPSGPVQVCNRDCLFVMEWPAYPKQTEHCATKL